MNTVNLYLLSGIFFKEISYINIIDLKEQLNKLLEEYNSDRYIQIVLNEIIINEGNEENNFNFYKINNLNKELEKKDFFQVIFILKSTIFIENKNNIFILNEKFKNDNYYKLIFTFSELERNWYNIIINNSYKNFILLYVKKYQQPIYNYISNNMKTDKEIILTLASSRGVRQGCGYDIDFPDIDYKFKNDKNIVFAAVNTYGSNLLYASDKIKNNKQIVLAAIKSEPYSLKYASDSMKNNKQVVLSAINKDGTLLIYASNKLRNNKEIVTVAVKQNGLALEHASFSLRNNKEIVLYATTQNIQSLEYASNRIKNNKYIMLILVKQNGFALEYTTDYLKNDKEVVLEAVKQEGCALQNASKDLQNNKEIVLVAIKQNGFAEDYINEDMKKDDDVKKAIIAFNNTIYDICNGHEKRR